MQRFFGYVFCDALINIQLVVVSFLELINVIKSKRVRENKLRL